MNLAPAYGETGRPLRQVGRFLDGTGYQDEPTERISLPDC